MHAVGERRRCAPVAPTRDAAVALGLLRRRGELGVAVHHEVAAVQPLRRAGARQPDRPRVEVPRRIERDAEMRERRRHSVGLVDRPAQHPAQRGVARHDERDLAVLGDVAPVVEVDGATVVGEQHDQPVLALRARALRDRLDRAAHQRIGRTDRREVLRRRPVEPDRVPGLVDIADVEEGEVELRVRPQRLDAGIGLWRVVLRVVVGDTHVDRVLRQDAFADRPPVAEIRGADPGARALRQREQRWKPLVVGDQEPVVGRAVLVRPHPAEHVRPRRA